jgi:hypothetical protein
MPNPEDFKDYQILGSNVSVILDGFGSFTLLASKILLESGLGKIDAEGVGMAVLEPEKWYPLDAFLRAFDRIQNEFGEFTLRQAGLYMHKKATPASDTTFKDISSAFATLDMGYHYNHAKNNQAMFNPQTGQMTEGIGHFKARTVPGKNQVHCDADSVYPCAFQEGIVQGLAQRFDPQARVTHDAKSCRKKGAATDTYTITWK